MRRPSRATAAIDGGELRMRRQAPLDETAHRVARDDERERRPAGRGDHRIERAAAEAEDRAGGEREDRARARTRRSRAHRPRRRRSGPPRPSPSIQAAIPCRRPPRLRPATTSAANPSTTKTTRRSRCVVPAEASLAAGRRASGVRIVEGVGHAASHPVSRPQAPPSPKEQRHCRRATGGVGSTLHPRVRSVNKARAPPTTDHGSELRPRVRTLPRGVTRLPRQGLDRRRPRPRGRGAGDRGDP